MATAKVKIWGQTVGYVSFEQGMRAAVFEYDPEFIKSGIELSPIVMPIDEAKSHEKLFSFPELEKSFMGLPGLLSDSLPDQFGNSIIDEWLRKTNRNIYQFSSVDRLCYLGKRGMGALEYEPAIIEGMDESVAVDIEQLTGLASDILNEREVFNTNLNNCLLYTSRCV